MESGTKLRARSMVVSGNAAAHPHSSKLQHHCGARPACSSTWRPCRLLQCCRLCAAKPELDCNRLCGAGGGVSGASGAAGLGFGFRVWTPCSQAVRCEGRCLCCYQEPQSVREVFAVLLGACSRGHSVSEKCLWCCWEPAARALLCEGKLCVLLVLGAWVRGCGV